MGENVIPERTHQELISHLTNSDVWEILTDETGYKIVIKSVNKVLDANKQLEHQNNFTAKWDSC